MDLDGETTKNQNEIKFSNLRSSSGNDTGVRVVCRQI